MKLGCLLPLSGRYKLIGDKVLRGIVTAVQSGNQGVKYEIAVEDIGDNIGRLKTAFDKLSRIKDMSFIVGPVPGKFVDAVVTQVNLAKIPTIVFPLTEDGASDGPHLIKYYYPLGEQADVLSRYAVKELGAKRFVVLYPK